VNKKLYIGNLPYSATETTLRELFASAGTVASATVITDGATGASKGVGFVEMSTEEEAQKAIDTLNGQEVGGRTVKVAEARPRREDRDGDRRLGRDRGGRRYDRW